MFGFESHLNIKTVYYAYRCEPVIIHGYIGKISLIAVKIAEDAAHDLFAYKPRPELLDFDSTTVLQLKTMKNIMGNRVNQLRRNKKTGQITYLRKKFVWDSLFSNDDINN